MAEVLDPELPPLVRLDYMIDTTCYWQIAASDMEGRMPGSLFGNLALEMCTRDDAMRAKLNDVFNKAMAQSYVRGGSAERFVGSNGYSFVHRPAISCLSSLQQRKDYEFVDSNKIKL